MHLHWMTSGSLRLTRLASTERETTVALIVHLAEFDARQLYRGAGFDRIMPYCVQVLRLSEDAAWNRIATARMARRYPMVIDRLMGGSLSPTTVRMIAKHATKENGVALVDAAKSFSQALTQFVAAGLGVAAGFLPCVIQRLSGGGEAGSNAVGFGLETGFGLLATEFGQARGRTIGVRRGPGAWRKEQARHKMEDDNSRQGAADAPGGLPADAAGRADGPGHPPGIRQASQRGEE